jgi:hypothetical protein
MHDELTVSAFSPEDYIKEDRQEHVPVKKSSSPMKESTLQSKTSEPNPDL